MPGEYRNIYKTARIVPTLEDRDLIRTAVVLRNRLARLEQRRSLDRLLEIAEDNRIDEDCVFYMRLDKQKAVTGTYEVAHHGDVIAITGKVQSHPARKEVAERVLTDFLSGLDHSSGSEGSS